MSDHKNQTCIGLLAYWNEEEDICYCTHPCVSNPSDCSIISCKNGGRPRTSMEIHIGMPPCVCPKLFCGPCCDHRYCPNGGTYEKGVCHCSDQFQGENCEESKCGFQGMFDSLNGTCVCQVGWEGPTCERVSCKNNGIWDEQNLRCICPNPKDFKGIFCDQLVCHRGKRQYDRQSLGDICVCPMFYKGERCHRLDSAIIAGVVVGAVIFLILLTYIIYVCYSSYANWKTQFTASQGKKAMEIKEEKVSKSPNDQFSVDISEDACDQLQSKQNSSRICYNPDATADYKDATSSENIKAQTIATIEPLLKSNADKQALS